MRLRTFAAFALLCTMSSMSAAHHGWSSYDSTKTFTVEASLLSLRWTNPHGTVTINRDGEIWTVLLAPISRMEQRGLTADMLKPGTKVTLIGQPRTDGTKEMKIQTITVAGKSYNLLA